MAQHPSVRPADAGSDARKISVRADAAHLLRALTTGATTARGRRHRRDTGHPVRLRVHHHTWSDKRGLDLRRSHGTLPEYGRPASYERTTSAGNISPHLDIQCAGATKGG